MSNVKTAVAAKSATSKKAVKSHTPWSVNGKTGYHQPLEGFKEGETKVRFKADGKSLVGIFKYLKISPVRYPEGKVFIEHAKGVFKRSISSVKPA